MNIQVEELSGYMLNGNVAKSWSYLETATYGKDSMAFYDALKECMYFIGELWEENAITVADEHIASHVCKTLLSYKYYHSVRKTPEVRPLRRKKAMFLCVDGEMHDLGIHMVSNYFHEHGWETQCLGASLPLNEAVEYAEKFQPDVIGLSANIPYHLPAINQYILALEQLPFGPAIMVGGKLASNHDLEFHCPPNTMIIRNLTEIEDLIKYMGTVQHGNAINV
ncbi:cobalamin-binding protein [Bacillus mangrovi]|uniref:Cobalamin-binding protein n=1 Tax=Metabacillus mangrovi TaxID=1491830 RepID=A0A7X2S4D9_9BACI|nr:cobalamin B12-binding domain-containing protein [Metabacillus mangrovi]MTH53469.1 cobalamin-binding protein [Metabacillus mangrovi]